MHNKSHNLELILCVNSAYILPVRRYEDTALFDIFESLKIVHMGLLILWIAHITACVWYYTGTIDEIVPTANGGNETIYGWVHTEYGPYRSVCNGKIMNLDLLSGIRISY